MNKMKAAHKMTREIKNEYPEVNYQFQLGLCLKFLYEEGNREEMVELKGSEKQIKWATQIREEKLKELDEFKLAVEKYVTHRAELFLRRNSKKTVEDLTEKRLRSYSKSFVELREFETGLLVEEIQTLRDELASEETSSAFYIETRMYDAIEIARKFKNK